ncbi:hypothetical protein Pfo_011590 [Paulownia fortunei]|nr:hypothetical protein Pfo_011590 [Paulownia fortunei]
MIMPNELNYSPIEKILNPLKYVMTRPVLSDRLARWYLQLQQIEIIYVPQKAVKGQVLADFLADHPIPAEWELSNDLPDKDVLIIEITHPWKMYFDKASHKKEAGAGVIFVTSDEEVLSYSFTLTQNCSNNVAKYQALVLGLEMTKVIGWLGDVVIEHIPRIDNKQADALANLASTLIIPEGEASVPICRSWVVPLIFEDKNCDEDEENHVVEVFKVEKENWRQPLIDYLKYEKLPDDPHQRVNIRRRAARFIHYKSTLYRRSFDGVFLQCLAHSGICGAAHQLGPKLHF